MVHQLVPSFPFFRYSFLCLPLQRGLTSAYTTAPWLLCAPGCIQATNTLHSTWRSQEVNPPSKTHPSPPSSQQSPLFVHIIQPLCLYIMLSPAFIHHCPPPANPMVPALTVCWWHSCTVTSRSPLVLCPAPRPPSQGQRTLVGPRPLKHADLAIYWAWLSSSQASTAYQGVLQLQDLGQQMALLFCVESALHVVSTDKAKSLVD